MTKRILSGIGCSLAALACCIGLYNGGSWDTTEVASATLAPLADLEEASFSTSFTNTDGSVQFFMNIPQSEPDSQMPRVYVRPHYLTGEDAQRVAEALFPETEFFEAEYELGVDSGAPIYSKAEIQAKLDRWTPYASQEALDEFLGETGRGREEVVQSFLEEYTEMYDQAPEENPHKVCTWELRKEPGYAEDANDEVNVRFSAGGIPYRFTASVRNKADFKVSMLSCFIYDGLCPHNLDETIFRARLCRTAAPTDEQVTAVRERTQELLASFGLGQWQIARCEAESRQCGSHTEHIIRAEAVPVLGGVPALVQPQKSALRNPQGEFTGHYLTNAQFAFAPNGELLSFHLDTPLDVQRVEPAENSGLTMQQILSMAQEQLVTTGPGRYGWYLVDEHVKCNVFLEDIHYGLTRMNVPGEDAYVYVPAASLWGVSEYFWDSGGEPLYQSERESSFLTIPFSNQT